jgi:hypothetical protein
MKYKSIFLIMVLLNLIFFACTDVDDDDTASESWGNWPDSTNTGLTDSSLLETYIGNMTVSTDNTTVENLEILGMLTIQADNVTVRNCRIWGPDVNACININAGTGILIEYCEITNDTPNNSKGIKVFARDDTSQGIITSIGYTIRNCYIHLIEDGISIGQSSSYSSAVHSGLIENNFITEMPAHNGSHNDGIHISGPVGGLIIKNNNIQIPDQQTSAVGMYVDYPGNNITNVSISQNLLNGGQYTLYTRTGTNGTISNINISGNYFGSDYISELWSTEDVNPENITNITTSGNIWYDTDESVSGHEDSGGLE